MGANKRELEIVYNLQWKNGSSHGNDKSNIVGMYDVPSTTLNWETFKSYLLKNSGAPADDIKVSYVSVDCKEFPIESQLDFQIALYSFRQRARNGEIITLRLERITDADKSMRAKRFRRSLDTTEEVKVAVEVPKVAVPNDAAPEWFKNYMKSFKKEIVEEVTASVLSTVSSSTKPQNHLQGAYHHNRKLKLDGNKRMKKHDVNDGKELLKSLKLERKLDCKLEKLEQKTQKIKEKKLALGRCGNNDGEIGRKSRPIGLPVCETEALMDASCVDKHKGKVLHMVGGETLQQVWTVINNGTVPWTLNTELRYAWGTEALKPLEKIVPCPKLEPGKQGNIVVYLEIPTTPGNYECYWHFYHEARRFGHWLGCHIIVDPSFKSASTENLIKDDENEMPLESMLNLQMVADQYKEDRKYDVDALKRKSLDSTFDLKLPVIDMEEINKGMNDLKMDEAIIISDGNSSSDTDNQSIVSIADSNSSAHSAQSDEFVLVPMSTPKDDDSEKQNILENTIPITANIKIEKIEYDEKNDDNNNSENQPEDKENNKEEKEEAQNNGSNYAYIVFEGEKLAVPKRYLRSDYLATAEDAPEPSTSIKSENSDVTVVSVTETTLKEQPYEHKIENKEFSADPTKMSQSMYTSVDCASKASYYSMTNSMHSDLNSASNKSRLFVFPQNCPGFEVVYPANSCPNENETSLMSELTQSERSCAGTCMSNSAYSEGLLPENPMFYKWYQSGTSYAYTDHDRTCSMSSSLKHQDCSSEGSTTTETGTTKNAPHYRVVNSCWSPPQCARNIPNRPCAPPCENVSYRYPMPPPPQNDQTKNDRADYVHMFPENFVSGAVNVASSAINTARSVLNMFSPPPPPPPPRQEHPPRSPPRQPENVSVREKALCTLFEMGFWNLELNASLLAKYNDDLARVISELIQ